MRRGVLDEFGRPPTQVIASALTERVIHTRGTPEHAGNKLLRKAAEQVACVSTRIGLDKEKGASLDHERPATKATDRTPEQLLEQLPRLPACRPITESAGQASDPAWYPLPLHEQATYSSKYLGAVGTPNDETKQAMDLLVCKTDPAPHVLTMRADLALHDIAESESSRDRLRGIFGFEKLHGKIHVAHDFEQSERHNSLDATRARVSGSRGGEVRQRASRSRGNSTREGRDGSVRRYRFANLHGRTPHDEGGSRSPAGGFSQVSHLSATSFTLVHLTLWSFLLMIP